MQDHPASGNGSDATECNAPSTPKLTSAYEARQQRAAADNARAVQRNQHRMDKQIAQNDVFFSDGDTVLVRVPHCCRNSLDLATIVGCVWGVQVTAVERRYRIATPAGALNRLLSGADLAKCTDGVAVHQHGIDAMPRLSESIRLEHAARSAFGRAQGAQPRAATAEQRARRPSGEWWCSF